MTAGKSEKLESAKEFEWNVRFTGDWDERI